MAVEQSAHGFNRDLTAVAWQFLNRKAGKNGKAGSAKMLLPVLPDLSVQLEFLTAARPPVGQHPKPIRKS
jgi:hypothetical protein